MSKVALEPVELPDVRWKQQFRRRLLAWFGRHARDLAWRRTRDPYAVWVSEIMLQQTQVATVEAYFLRFLAAFPTIADLAAAAEDDVLRLWEGLGYYRRARQLHAAARQIVRDLGGKFPEDPEQVLRLPGIGRYTAGAILSIAFDARQPILEANTFRLLARLIAWPHDPQSSGGQRVLWQLAEALLPRSGSGTFNQALMELGSLLCTPRNPRCGECPVAGLCPTRARGLQAKIPPPRARATIEAVSEAAVVIQRRGRVFVGKRPEGERWAGLWDFPRFGLGSHSAANRTAELIGKVHAQTGLTIEPLGLLTTLRHGVTRFRITLACYEARLVSGRVSRGVEHRWASLDELSALPLSVTGRKIACLLAAKTPAGKPKSPASLIG